MIQDQPPEDNVQWEMPERRRPRRTEEETEDVGFPIVWVLIGGLAALLTIGLVALGLVRIFTRTTTAAATPTLVSVESTPALTTEMTVVAVQTPAPTEESMLVPTFTPTVPPTPTPVPPTPTPQPTPTPTPPTGISVGGYVRIVNTEGKGLSLRAGPARSTARLVVAGENAVLPVLDGPRDDQDGERDETGALYQWWYLRNTDGSEGWGRADFLEPAPPPE